MKIENFEEAVNLLIDGACIRQKSWDRGRYIYLNKNGNLCDESSLITSFEFFNEGWESYEKQKPKLYDFSWALMHLREGRKIKIYGTPTYYCLRTNKIEKHYIDGGCLRSDYFFGPEELLSKEWMIHA